MKGLLCLCFLLELSSLVLAEPKHKVAEKKVKLTASDRSSDSKSKRDASLLTGSYHGPSYKYLPPSGGASSYDSYAGGYHGLVSAGSGHSSGFGGGYSSNGLGHSSGSGSGYSSSGLGHSSGYAGGYSHSSGFGGGHSASGLSHSLGSGGGLGHSSGFGGGPSVSHHQGSHHGTSSAGFDYASAGHHAASSGVYSGHSSGSGIVSSGVGYASSGHYSGGQGVAHHSAVGIKGGSHGYSSAPTYSAVSLGHDGFSGAGHNSFASSGADSSSGLGYKTHVITLPSFSVNAGHSGSSAGSSTGYHYSKGSPSYTSSTGFDANSFGSSHSLASAGGHHPADDADHVHNGEQQHHYAINSGQTAGAHGAAASASSSSLGHQSGYSYESPVRQHVLPATSYGLPRITVYPESNYHSQQTGHQDLGPIYAAGHKGLGHFTDNKPQQLHTSIKGSSFRQASYSKAPFRPSAFLGAKYEGSAHNEESGQQYLAASTGVGADSTGHDYAIASGPSAVYQEPQYQTNVEAQATPIHETVSNYNNEVGYSENSSAGSYLAPSQNYGAPYKH